ncbi:hypothetical protein [Dactylosporangium sp. CA-233914]
MTPRGRLGNQGNSGTSTPPGDDTTVTSAATVLSLDPDHPRR